MTRRRSVSLFAKQEPAVTGTSRYALSLCAELPSFGYRTEVLKSKAPWPHSVTSPLRRAGVDPDAFWTSFPLLAPRTRADLTHLTTQTLATALLLARPAHPTVVTVHDILPYTLRKDPGLRTLRRPVDRFFYELALRGLGRADAILADSAYTAGQLAHATRARPDRIRVVPLGVDVTRFYPECPPDEARRRSGFDGRYVLYVGSEDPRKNLPSLWRAFARVRGSRRDLVLVKAGAPHHVEERRRLEQLGDELGIADSVRFVGEVSEEQLRLLYVGADVCVVPSTHEGFGLPVLEAMACAAPVVCSNRTSLPEVAGEAAMVVEPDVDSLAAAIEQVLADATLASSLRERGRARASAYSWRRTAELTAATYDALLGSGNP